MKPLTGEVVKKKIIDRFTNNDRINVNNIHVSVKGNKVLLEGHVPSFSVKMEAFRNATETAKGFVVVNDLQVYFPASQTIVSDKEILENIRENFKWQRSINASKIKVNVKQSKVLLSGIVANISENIAAEKIAGSIKGVTELENHIEVKPEMLKNDDTIEKELQNSFVKSDLIDQQKIETKVNSGTVYLSGCVASETIRKVIEEKALHILGVTSVINKITLE